MSHREELPPPLYLGPDRRVLGELPAPYQGMDKRVINSFDLTEEQVCSPRVDAYDIQVFTEYEEPGLAQEAWRLQGISYKDSGFVLPDALIDGCLPPDIDTTRGSNVTYRIATHQDNPNDRATIRKEVADDFRDLSVYKLCKDALTREGREQLKRAQDEGYYMANIAALGTSSRLFHRGAHALFRDIVQDAMLSGRRERWFFGIVVSTFSSLVHSYGVDTFQVIGKDVEIKDSRVRPGLKLRPTLVNPDTYIDTMVGSQPPTKIRDYLEKENRSPANEAARARRELAVTKYSWRLTDNIQYFTDGLTEAQMGPRVYRARQAIMRHRKSNDRKDMSTP
ncbi:MAG: hypothetical protein WBP26_00385 [Candidatus Saccharimonadales bacterium]